MFKKTTLAAFIAAALLTGCGDDTVIPPEAPIGSIKGNAVDALIIGGTVRAYTFENGVKGEEITVAPVITDEKGYFKIDVQANRDMPILLEVRGGYYIEEASGTTISLNDEQWLNAVYNYTHGEDLDLMVTTWTHLATAEAVYRIKQGVDAKSAVDDANSAVSSWLGVDILKTYPVNITDASFDAQGFYAGVKYGLSSAALSQWTHDLATAAGIAPHKAFSSIMVNNVLYADIVSDGKLDGVVDGAHIRLGNVTLSADIIRQGLGAGMLRVVQRPDVNKIGVDLSDSIPYAKTFAASTISLFGDDTPLPIDETLPVIDWANEKPQYPVATGSVSVKLTSSDFIGMDRVELWINGEKVSHYLGSDGELKFDSKRYPDGDMVVTVVGVDILDNKRSIDYPIIIANNTLAIEYSSNTRIATNEHTVKGRVHNAFPPIEINIGGVNASVDEEGFFFADLTLPEGINRLAVSMADRTGRVTDSTHTVYVDRTAPDLTLTGSNRINIWRPDGSVVPGEFPADERQVIHLKYDSVRLGLTPVDTKELDKRGITFVELEAVDPGEVNTPAEKLSAFYSVYVNDEVKLKSQRISRSSNGRFVLPFTYEFLPGLLSYSNEDKIEIVFSVNDELNNKSFISQKVALFVDLPHLQQWTMFPNSKINAGYYHSPDLGEVVAVCDTTPLAECDMKFQQSFPALAVSVANGVYRDIDNKIWPIDIDKPFNTLVDFYEQDKQVYLTLLAAGYKGAFDHFTRQGLKPKNAYDNARERMVALYGFDPLATGVESLCNGCELTPERQHALLLGGFSLYAEQNNLSSPQVFADTLSIDLAADGVLDGKGVNGEQLFMGKVAVTHETYRADIYRAINEYHSLLGKPLGDTTVGVWAQEQSLRINDNFNVSDVPRGMDTQDPFAGVISHFDKWVNGIITFDINSDDDIGMSYIALKIAGALIGEKRNSYQATFDVDTNKYDDGEQKVRVDVIDDVNKPSFVEGKILVDNTPPKLSVSPLENKWVTGEFDFSIPIEEISPYKHEVYVNDKKIGESEAGEVKLDLSAYPDGELVLTSKVTDSVEQKSNKLTKLFVDNKIPEIGDSGLAGKWHKGNLDYTASIIDASVNEILLTVDGKQVVKGGAGAKLVIPTKQYPDGMKKVKLSVTDKVGKNAEKEEMLGFDNTAPIIYASSMLDQWYSGNVNFEAEIEEISPYINTVTINGTKFGEFNTHVTPIDTRALKDGIYDVEYNVKDSVELTAKRNFVFQVDNFAPVISASPFAGTWQKGDLNFYARITEDNAYQNEVSVNGIRHSILNSSDELLIKTSSYPDGLNNINYSVTDASGKTAQLTTGVNFDNNPPVFAVSGLNNKWQKGVFEYNAPVTDASPTRNVVTIDNKPFVTVGNGETFTVDTTGYPEGIHVFNMTATDSVGHVSKLTENVGFDNTPPVFTPSALDGTWQKGTFTFDSKVVDASPTKTIVTMDGNPFKEVNNDSVFTVDTKSFPEGTHTLELNAIDSVGFTAQKTVSISFDNTAPVIYEASLTPNKWYSGNVTFSPVITETSPFVNVVTLNGTYVGEFSDNTVSFDTALFADGSYQLGYRVTDSVDLTTEKMFAFNIDNNAPIIGEWTGAERWHRGSMAVSVGVDDFNARNLNSKLLIDNLNQGSFSDALNKSVDTRLLANGSHTLKVTSIDPAGHSTEKSWGFSVDNDIPVIPNWAGANKWHKGNVPLSFSITDFNAASLNTRVFLDDNDFGSFAGVVNKTINTASIGNGNHKLSVSTSDPAGNTASVSWPFSVDNDVPVIPNWSGANKWHKGSFEIDLTLTDFNASSLSTKLYLDGVHQSDYTSRVRKTYNSNTLSNGAHTFKITTVDPAGNAKEASLPFSIDNLAPVIGVDSSRYEVKDVTSAKISGPVSDAHSGVSRVTVNGAAATVSGGRWSFTAQGLKEGLNSYSIVAVDNVGLTSNAATAVNLTKTPDQVMSGLVSCGGTSGAFPGTSQIACSSSGANAIHSVNMDVTFNQCARAGTCSVTWTNSNGPISQSGNGAVISRSLNAKEKQQGVATATMIDKANNHTITYKVNWTLERTSECVAGATDTKELWDCGDSRLHACDPGIEQRSCGSDGMWGDWKTTRPLFCVDYNMSCN
ncbi:hypothetical protein [Shewanella algae]|uniref:hypothetical protein n=1 Tax=Shewanella algae TaxID=38313 RepID=UPI0031F52B2A